MCVQYEFVLTLSGSVFSRKCLYLAGGRGIGGNRTLTSLRDTRYALGRSWIHISKSLYTNFVMTWKCWRKKKKENTMAFFITYWTHYPLTSFLLLATPEHLKRTFYENKTVWWRRWPVVFSLRKTLLTSFLLFFERNFTTSANLKVTFVCFFCVFFAL